MPVLRVLLAGTVEATTLVSAPLWSTAARTGRVHFEFSRCLDSTCTVAQWGVVLQL